MKNSSNKQKLDWQLRAGLITESKYESLIANLQEDETQDKLDDLSSAFQNGSVEAYVTKLKKYQADPKVHAALTAGQTDGKPEDEKFAVSNVDLVAENLKPTQNEIGAEESLKNILDDKYGSLDGFLKGTAKFPDPIIVYNGKFVIDGHHRWSQVYAANPKCKIPALNVKGKIDPKDVLKAVHAAISAESGETKTISANLKAGNLLTFNAETVKKYVAENLQDKARQVWKANGVADDQAIADTVSKNVETMIAKSKPESWAPKRDFMPQPGVSNADDFGVGMVAGSVNLIDPKTTDVKESSAKKSDKLLMEALKKGKI